MFTQTLPDNDHPHAWRRSVLGSSAEPGANTNSVRFHALPNRLSDKLQIRDIHQDQLPTHGTASVFRQIAFEYASNSTENRGERRQIDVRQITEDGIRGAGEHRSRRSIHALETAW
ncbi:hypothetical protein [Burkholderia sp. Ac-20384]|uniref:hypothetical protein n=1 Tax=Burkholderia sp. Ac-20384 TaxID=2703902 RepID=UPI001980DD34|nr:hypothetical protein [Burkholderia sp. Ac-20384]